MRMIRFDLSKERGFEILKAVMPLFGILRAIVDEGVVQLLLDELQEGGARANSMLYHRCFPLSPPFGKNGVRLDAGLRQLMIVANENDHTLTIDLGEEPDERVYWKVLSALLLECGALCVIEVSPSPDEDTTFSTDTIGHL